jgi:hypothetical protein
VYQNGKTGPGSTLVISRQRFVKIGRIRTNQKVGALRGWENGINKVVPAVCCLGGDAGGERQNERLSKTFNIPTSKTPE